MTTLDLDRIVWTTTRTEDFASFVAFVDACFGLPAGVSLRWTFPVALQPEGDARRYEARVGGELVSAAAAVVRDWATSAGTVRAACVGCFSTHPDRRGRGLSRAVQEHVLTALAAEGVEWAALWTDAPELYRGRGFEPAGREFHLELAGVRWPAPPPGCRVRTATAADAPSLLALHRAHPLRVERTLEDFRAHLHPATTEAFVVERDGEILAYATFGKGLDFAGYVSDFGGEVEAVHSLWGLAHRRGASTVLVPDGASAYFEGVARAARADVRRAAYVRHLSGDRDPRDCAWGVSGLDSA